MACLYEVYCSLHTTYQYPFLCTVVSHFLFSLINRWWNSPTHLQTISIISNFLGIYFQWDKHPRSVIEAFVLLLSPYAPHMAEELWSRLGHTKSLAYEPFPKVWIWINIKSFLFFHSLSSCVHLFSISLMITYYPQWPKTDISHPVVILFHSLLLAVTQIR